MPIIIEFLPQQSLLSSTLDTKSHAPSLGGVQPTDLEASASLFNGYYVTIPDQEGSKVSPFCKYTLNKTCTDIFFFTVGLACLFRRTGYA